MERFMQREKVMVEYGLSGDSPKSPHRRSSEDLDFNDVFGGPPRRFSMQEVRVRYSFGEPEEEEGASSSSSKPVFGEESAARRRRRRRRQGDDFFDDIFRGDECCGSPRRAGNLIGSNPGSRIMSPVRTLPPKTDPFGGSFPAQFSLPAKLTKAVEPPTFALRNHNRNKMDGSASGSNSPRSSSSLSRFSNLGIRGYDGIRNDVYPIHHQSLLPHEASFTTEDSPFAITSDQKESIENMKNDTRNVDGFGNEFHFSIYKWAGGGVQMLMPLDRGNNLKSKDISIKDMCASSNGESDHMEPESFKMEEIKKLQNSSQYDIPESKTRSSSKDRVVFGGTKENTKDEQVKSLDEIDTREKSEKEVPLNIEKSRKSEAKPFYAFLSDGIEVEQPGNITEMNENKTRFPKEAHESKNTKKNVGTAIDLKNATVDKSSLPGAAINSWMASGKSRVARKVRDFVQIFNQDADSRPKADVQTRSQSFRWKDVGVKQDENEVRLNAAKVKEKVNLQNAAKNPDFPLKDADSRPKADFQTRSHSFRWKDVGVKQDENEVSLNAAKVKEKVNLQNADKNLDFSLKDADSRPKADVQTRSQSFRWKDVGVKQDENEVSLNAAKVKEKVNLQNADKNPNFSLKDADSRPKADVQTRSQSFRWKDVGIKQDENEVSLNAAKVKEKVNLQNADKNPDFSLKVDENMNKDEAQHSRTSRRSYHFSANQKNAFLSESIHKDSKISVEILDDFLEDNFLVQEIFDDHEKETQSEVSEDIKALDTKIQQWSVGKEGNIRSLLSTLQYVLWAGSGWKPVALVDLIEANSVKQAYQRALLRLHPDKLQQKDAAVHHKYIAEKVFDILQEAWDDFNTLDPL